MSRERLPITLFIISLVAVVYIALKIESRARAQGAQPETVCMSGQGEIIFDDASRALFAVTIPHPHPFRSHLNITANQTYDGSNPPIFILTASKAPNTVIVVGHATDENPITASIPISWIACETSKLEQSFEQYIPLTERSK